jgi:DeoR/GlpR family transcriptional regulator of sugar metabolism
MDMMNPEDRRTKIVTAVRVEGRVSVERLAQALSASRETIRRDLAELDRRGLVRKVHGGAAIIEPGGVDLHEGPLAARMAENLKAKRAIGREAVKLFSPGDSLFIDTGSTTLAFAEELASASGLTVITNSAAIAALAAKGSENRVFLIGGEYRRGGQESVGEIATAQIGQFRATHAVLTVAAVSETGFMDHDLQEAQIARAMIHQAAQVTILADSTKMGKLGMFELGPLNMARRLVTDQVPHNLALKLRSAEVETILAG